MYGLLWPMTPPPHNRVFTSSGSPPTSFLEARYSLAFLKWICDVLDRRQGCNPTLGRLKKTTGLTMVTKVASFIGFGCPRSSRCVVCRCLICATWRQRMSPKSLALRSLPSPLREVLPFQYQCWSYFASCTIVIMIPKLGRAADGLALAMPAA